LPSLNRPFKLEKLQKNSKIFLAQAKFKARKTFCIFQAIERIAALKDAVIGKIPSK